MKDKACASTLFSPIEMRRFLSSFDTDEFEKLSQCEGFGEPRFRNWLLKIGQFRENAQNYAKFRETGSTCLQVTSASSGNNKINRNYKQVQPSLVAFKHSRRYENCRICNHLSKMGDTRMLYDNHNSNYPSGCPRFITMCIEERLKVCKDAKICFRCHNPSYVWKFADIKAEKHKCVSRSTKGRYVCQNSMCNVHIWCCVDHHMENESALKKFQHEIRSKFNLEFCFSAVQSWKIGHSIPYASSNAENSMNNVDQSTVESPISKAKQNLSSSQALSKMKKKLKGQGLHE